MNNFKKWIINNIKVIILTILSIVIITTFIMMLLNKQNNNMTKNSNNTESNTNVKVNEDTSNNMENKADNNSNNDNNDNDDKQDETNNNKQNNINTDFNTNNDNNKGNNESKENIQEYPSYVSFEQAEDLHLTVGDTYQLKLKTDPVNVKNNNGTYSSTDESIATVDSNGKITALRNGFCNITFTTENGLKASIYLGVFYTILGTKNFNKVIYNQNGITITVENFIYDMEADSSPMYFRVINNSGSTIGIFVSNKPNYASASDFGVTINGKQINNQQMSYVIVSDVVDDSAKNGYISFKQDYLRINQIKQINTLSFYLIFIDDKYTQKFSSDLITIDF